MTSQNLLKCLNHYSHPMIRNTFFFSLRSLCSTEPGSLNLIMWLSCINCLIASALYSMELLSTTDNPQQTWNIWHVFHDSSSLNELRQPSQEAQESVILDRKKPRRRVKTVHQSWKADTESDRQKLLWYEHMQVLWSYY